MISVFTAETFETTVFLHFMEMGKREKQREDES